jgi:hypothetical protein
MTLSRQEIIDELRRLRDDEEYKQKHELDPAFREKHQIRVECYQKALRLMNAI